MVNWEYNRFFTLKGITKFLDNMDDIDEFQVFRGRFCFYIVYTKNKKEGGEE